jgi:TolB-like protein
MPTPTRPFQPTFARPAVQNLSGDVEQERRWLVEDIITALSRISAFFVIA